MNCRPLLTTLAVLSFPFAALADKKAAAGSKAPPAAGTASATVKESDTALPALKFGEGSQIEMPPGVAALGVLRVQAVRKMLADQNKQGFIDGVLAGIAGPMLLPLPIDSILSLTFGATDDGTAVLIYALNQPLDIERLPNLSLTQPLAGWKTVGRGSGAVFCQLNSTNIMMANTSMNADGPALRRIVRELTQIRARAVGLPLVLRCGNPAQLKGSLPAGSITDQLRGATVEAGGSTPPEIVMTLDYITAEQATEVSKDATAALQFAFAELKKMTGEQMPPPSVQAQGTRVTARVTLDPAILARAAQSNGSAALEARNKRTAQNIVSVYQSARACGIRELDGAKSVSEIISALEKGATVAAAGSPFDGKTFRIEKLSTAQADGALPYIKFTDQGLDYDPKGTAAPDTNSDITQTGKAAAAKLLGKGR